MQDVGLNQELILGKEDDNVEIKEVDINILDAFQIPQLKEISEFQNANKEKIEKAKSEANILI